MSRTPSTEAVYCATTVAAMVYTNPDINRMICSRYIVLFYKGPII